MATITTANSESIYTIKKFLGLNESPGGDTQLKMGEAAKMLNFKITRENTLKTRPGSSTIATLSSGNEVKGIWCGYVDGAKVGLAACNGKLYEFYNGASYTVTELGALDTSNRVHIFGFNGKAYCMNGTQYKVYDGDTFADVTGYVPIILVSTAPSGAGTTLQQINKLSASRKVWFSPDGTSTVFQLPETALASIDHVIDRTTSTELTCTKDASAGTVTFASAPTLGVNAIEIEYTASTSFASTVKAMRYSELYNGTQDTLVWLYGDGTNTAFYSGLDYDGEARADYFPDMNEMEVGDSSTPITAMIRHYSQLMIFKTDSAWSCYQSLTETDDGTISAFYLKSVNKIVGCTTPGQARLILNSPVMICNNELYEWKNSSSYASNINVDERQAKRISDRIYSTLSSFDSSATVCWDDDVNQEYYIAYNGYALVWNYAVDAWYYYSMNAKCLSSLNGAVVFGGSDGKIRAFSDSLRTDDGTDFDYEWVSGSMSFGADFRRKFTSTAWITLKPETNSSCVVSYATDRVLEGTEKQVSANATAFSTWNFATLSFKANPKPQEFMLRLKAKKFVHLSFVIKNPTVTSGTRDTACTVLSADFKIRFTGYAK